MRCACCVRVRCRATTRNQMKKKKNKNNNNNGSPIEWNEFWMEFVAIKCAATGALSIEALAASFLPVAAVAQNNSTHLNMCPQSLRLCFSFFIQSPSKYEKLMCIVWVVVVEERQCRRRCCVRVRIDAYFVFNESLYSVFTSNFLSSLSMCECTVCTHIKQFNAFSMSPVWLR